MDLDEKYVSVILRRYVDNGGDSSDVYCIRNGEKVMYADVAKEVEKRDGSLEETPSNDLI